MIPCVKNALTLSTPSRPNSGPFLIMTIIRPINQSVRGVERLTYLLGKGGYVFGSVGLSVCGQHYSKSYERIGMKCYGGVLGSTMKN